MRAIANLRSRASRPAITARTANASRTLADAPPSTARFPSPQTHPKVATIARTARRLRTDSLGTGRLYVLAGRSRRSESRSHVTQGFIRSEGAIGVRRSSIAAFGAGGARARGRRGGPRRGRAASQGCSVQARRGASPLRAPEARRRGQVGFGQDHLRDRLDRAPSRARAAGL